ncbi:preprotein translocase subunit SecE [Oenococcus sp. UCMA 16435]|nr:preprotein translocase subunit SecE [Oenococcus sp. UCMA 16435]MDI4583531.1 preprotein translocase subunit SecE [Oenococcus sp. UCMA 14587]MDN6967726.1 preprotein translocase subunit SecE [Oenococcus sp. UCMA 17063]
MIRYIKGTIEEMKNVTWLNGNETSRDTNYVIITSIFFSGFLALVDLLVSIGIKFLMNK